MSSAHRRPVEGVVRLGAVEGDAGDGAVDGWRRSCLELREDRDVVAGALPAADVAGDAAAAGAFGEVGGGPDVVEAAALVGGVPVGGAVGPPGIEPALRRRGRG